MNLPISNFSLLIYGQDVPKIGFTQSPSGEIALRIDNEKVIRYDPEKEDLTWADILQYPSVVESIKEPEELRTLFLNMTSQLSDLAQSGPEKKFFNDYVSSCFYFDDWSWKEIDRSRKVWNSPALIPQVWVNWIHYDAKDAKRAELAQREPFRVDFVMKRKEIHSDLIIIEIDGPTHFGEYKIDSNGKPVLLYSMDSYTKHIKKDRWLRNQQWKVFRVTSQEIDEYKIFAEFFNYVFGKWILDEIPF